MLSTWLKLVLVSAFTLALSACAAPEPSDPVGLTGEQLYAQVLDFQGRIDTAFGTYAGVSFDGLEPYLGNMVVYLVGDSEVEVTRQALLETFGEPGEAVEIRTWSQTSTVADEQLKNEVGQVLIDHVLTLDYDELIDRIAIGLDTLDVVTAYEQKLVSELGVARDVFSFEAEVPACTDELGARYEPETLSLKVGEAEQLSVTLLSCGGTEVLEDDITWLSDNPDIASVVPDSGVVTALSEGETFVRASGAFYGEVGGVPVTVE